jgi:hypothetical protein
MRTEIVRAKDVQVGDWINVDGVEFAPVRQREETDAGMEFRCAAWGVDELVTVVRRNGEAILRGRGNV